MKFRNESTAATPMREVKLQQRKHKWFKRQT